MWLLVPFIAVPLIEIALFIQVGGVIGLWPTLVIVLLTAILGSWLVRNQGALALSQIRGSLNRLSDPTEPLAHGAMIVFSGALLLTPGFFTDAVGFALLVPGVRRWAYRRIAARLRAPHADGARPARGAGTAHGPRRSADRGDVIDADYVEVKPPQQTAPVSRPGAAASRPSGWTQR